MRARHLACAALAALPCALGSANTPPPAISRLPRSAVMTPLRFRGGAANAPPTITAAAPRQKEGAAVPAISPTQARVLLLLAGCIYGTYPVLLRALNAVGGEPLPAVFVTAARYQFLAVFALIDRLWRAAQQRPSAVALKDAGAASAPAHSAAEPAVPLSLAAIELAAYTVCGTLLSIYGIELVTAVTSEILSSTIHMFVPLQTLALVGGASFGAPTWAGCLIAFCAAIFSCVLDGSQSGGGGGGGGGHALGAAATIASSFLYGLSRVRASSLLRGHEPAALNARRMTYMGLLSVVVLLIDVSLGGPSAYTLRRVAHILPAQWALLVLSVFSSAFVASSLQFKALKVLPAANAQPFFALQPLFAALWSQLLLSEPITRGALLGSTLMIGATLLACTDPAVARRSGIPPAGKRR